MQLQDYIFYYYSNYLKKLQRNYARATRAQCTSISKHDTYLDSQKNYAFRKATANNLGRREYFRTYRCLDYGCNTGTDMIGPWDRPCLCQLETIRSKINIWKILDLCFCSKLQDRFKCLVWILLFPSGEGVFL